MDADGKPTNLYDEGDRRQIGSDSYTSQDSGFTSARRLPLKSQHSLDSHTSHEVQLSRPLAETHPSDSNASVTNGSTASLTSGVADSWLLSVSGLGRSLSLGNLLRSYTTHEKQPPEPNHRLSVVPELTTQSETTDLISSQNLSLAGSRSCQILPVIPDVAPHEPIAPNLALNTAAVDSKGAITFSARDVTSSPMRTSQIAAVDHFSFFGLPRRINVSKRELNMMTPSSF